MRLSQLLLPELHAEAESTRRVLERVPDAQGDGEWRPHEKAFPMAHLAQLVARLPGWAPMMLDRTELDISPVEGPKFPGYSIAKTATLVAEFDRNVEAAKKAIELASDEDFQVPWTLKKSGQVVMTQSRYQMLRFMVLNHLVHHRAQLGFYLRLVGRQVPEMYGPTADTKQAT